MSVAKHPKPRKKTDKRAQIFCHEAQNVGSKHEDVVDDTQSLHQSSSKDIINNNTLSTKKKDFVIPRKKKQAKELLQLHHFDSRETKELLRSVQLSLRDPGFWSSYKFKRVEFVNNEKLARKYGEKKQALRHETRTNLEDKFAFLFTTSRTEVKLICEHGLRTGNSLLTSLGDPKLGVYLCRFADVIYKRPLTTEDSGYLLVFRVVKGKVRFIGGSNPELQPTPHHDCHVSKALTTLSSKASHSDVFESSQLYFYEFDENSDDFHVKYPRQVLPYAVLTFTILKPERQQSKLDDTSEGKKAVVIGHDFPLSTDENILSSPKRIESKDDLISNSNISWSGVLAINKKQFAYVDFVSYSRKRHPLPINVDHFNISQKVSHDDLRSLLKCPIFSNGKPASSGVCIELSHGRKFVYYEVRVVNQIQEKFDELVSHFVDTEMAGVIEYQYFKGPVYLYLIPTSKLTNDIGITDKKSQLALHALVQVKHIRRLPNDQVPNEKQQDAGTNDTLLNEAIVKSQVQEFFKKKHDSKQLKVDGKTTQNKLSPLLSRRIPLEDRKIGPDKAKSVLEARSMEVRLSLPPEGGSHEKRIKFQNEAQNWVDNFFSPGKKERGSNVEKHESSSGTSTSKSRYKWVSPKRLDKKSFPSEAVSCDDESIKTSKSEKDDLSSKNTSDVDQGIDVEQAQSVQHNVGNQDLGRNEGIGVVSLDNAAASGLQSENVKPEIDFLIVQKLIKEFQHHDKQGKSTAMIRSSGQVDPRLQRRSSSSSSMDNNPDKLPSIPPLLPPPIPPPPPPPISPFLRCPLPSSSAVGNTPVSTSEPSSATDLPLVTSPVSPPAVKRQEMMLIPGLEPTGSPVFQLMRREKVSFMNQSICTSASYLKDSLISTQCVTAWNQMHPSSPITTPSSSENTPNRTSRTDFTPVFISNSKSYTTMSENREYNQEVQTRSSYTREDSPKIAQTPPAINYDSMDKCAAQSNMLDSDIPDIPGYDNVVITRPLTEAEKNSSRAIREIKNILLRNRDGLKNTSSEDDNNHDHSTGHKSEISGNVGLETETNLEQASEDRIVPYDRPGEAEYGSRKLKEYSKKENIAKEFVVKSRISATDDRYVNEKDGRNVGEMNVSRKQPMKNLLLDKKISAGTPDKWSLKSDSACSSPHTPELKSGLDLLDNLISCQKRGHQPSQSKSDPHRPRVSNESDIRSKSRSRETTPRKERSSEERKKISKSRKRKVTIKRSNAKVNENKWDDMTSDISDTELPLDSDVYITEKHKNNNAYKDHKTSPRSKDVSRPSSRDGLEATYHHDRYSKERSPPRRTVSIAPKRERSIDTHRGNRDDHDDWDREWKRRKLGQDQAQEISEPSSHDNESTHSDSDMSTSSLDSVSFEYAVPNEESPYDRYRFVRASPINGRSLKITITRDIECSHTFPSHTNPDDCAIDPYRTCLLPPSSPVEVDMIANSVIPDSPGTPETAVPSEDFLHNNIGYWSTGCITEEGADILPEDMDDKCFEPIQQDTIEDSTYGNDQGTWSTPSSPYHGCGDDRDGSTACYKQEKPVVKKSQGEGYCQRRHSSSGASTGYDYDNSSNQSHNPDYYRPIDHDGQSLRGSTHTEHYTVNNYDNLSDLNDIYMDRYPHSSERYSDPGDHGLFYASRSPYGDTNSHHMVDAVEELGSNKRYYTSDRMESYSTRDWHDDSPLYISERSCDYSERRGIIDDDYEQRLPTNGDQTYDFSVRRENNDNDYRPRGAITNNGWPSQYSPERSEITDRYRQESPLTTNNRTSQYSPESSRTTDDDYRRGSCSPHISNDRHSHYPAILRAVSDDGYGQRSSLENSERRSHSPDRREAPDKSHRQSRSSLKNSEMHSYSPDHLEICYKNHSHSPDQKGFHEDNYGQSQSSLKNSKRRSHSPDQRGFHEDNYGQNRSSLKNSKKHSYSPDRRLHEESYGQSLEKSESRSYSANHMGICDESYGQRSPIANAQRQSYSPVRRVTSDSYRQRSSLKNSHSVTHRHSHSPDQKGVTDDVSYEQRSPHTTVCMQSQYSTFQRRISDECDQRSPSPVNIDDCPSRYSPERTPQSDKEFDEYYEASGNDIPGIKYQQDYENDQEFPPGIEEEKDSHFDVDVFDEEQQGNVTDEEDHGIEHLPRYTFDNVERSYSSDEETFEGDSVDTPEYYDKEQHKYLDDIVENNISATTLELDHAVFDGFRDFPQLLELAKYLSVISRTSGDGEVVSNAVGTDSSGNGLANSRDPRLNKGSSNGSGTEGTSGGESHTDRHVTEAGKKKQSGDHRKVVKPFPKKQSYFYVYNPDNDPECEAVKHYMLKTGAQFLDVNNENNLKNMTGELRVLVRRKHRPSIHRIRNLVQMKLSATAKFALFNTVEDVSKKTKAYSAIFQYGGVLIPDDAILKNIDPALLEALLGFMAEQNAIHQKSFWVMNIRYIAYKKLGSQRPLTWRDAFVLDLLRKYRNERFVNIINKDYVMENVSPVQRYLDTALKQQLELMPTYRHFILLSDLNKQIVEVSWFFNRGIGFMDVKEWLDLFVGEAKTQQLLSASKYTKDGSEYTTEGTRQDTLQYDTIDSPEDDEAIEPSSTAATTTHIPNEFTKPSHEGHHQHGYLSRSLSCNMVSRSTNYKEDNSNMKEKRLEILSSINNVKTNLMNDIGVRGNTKAKEDCFGTQGNFAKQQQFERSKSYEPRLRVHNERVIPKWTNNYRTYDTTKTLDKNGLPDFKGAQYPKALYEKRYHGNGRNNNNYKGTIPGTFN